MNKLYPAQREAVLKLVHILNEYPGAILRADEGTGKTIMAAQLASILDKKTLFVGNAFAKKDVEKKLEQYTEWGIEADITCVSYHAFGNINKINPNDYEFIIFDECHMLRNWTNNWTQRFVRLRNKQFLFMSGTPMIKSPKDFMYVARKCGIFEGSTDDFKRKYFGAKPSHFGNFLELGEFQNEVDFQVRLDKVCVELTHRQLDKSIPDLIPAHYLLEGEYVKPESIKEETQKRLEAGLSKVAQACRIIREEKKERSLILCYFHDTAKAVAENLGVKASLTGEAVYKAIEDSKRNGGHVVATLGLTQSSFDFNECDTVYLVESNYSYPLDRQSIRRCQRVGKRNKVDVKYFVLEGEQSLITSWKRHYLTRRFDGKTFSPSQLAIWEKCPGSYWLEEEDKPEFLIKAATKGTHNHRALELCLKNPGVEIPDSVDPIVQGCIEHCRKLMEENVMHGVESKVTDPSIDHRLRGMVDFWAYDTCDNHLTVIDYKNGKTPVSVEDNLQLLTYAHLVTATFMLNPTLITLGIYQRDKYETVEIHDLDLKDVRKRIENIINRILAAEKNPLEHLNEGECSFFCAAKRHHQAKEKEMNDFTPRQKLPRHEIKGKVFFTRSKKTVKGAVYTQLGIAVNDVPSSLTAKYPEGSSIGKQLKGKSNKDAGEFYLFNEDEQSGGYSIFLNLFADFNTGELKAVGKGDEVTIQAIAKEVVKDGEVKLFLNIKEIEVSASEEEADSVEY